MSDIINVFHMRINDIVMTPESRDNGARINSPLLGNGSINKFPLQRARDVTSYERPVHPIINLNTVSSH
jgi:hypothetical protein